MLLHPLERLLGVTSKCFEPLTYHMFKRDGCINLKMSSDGPFTKDSLIESLLKADLRRKSPRNLTSETIAGTV